MKPKRSWAEKGYIDEAVPEGIDIRQEIQQLCEQKNAVILAHYYVDHQIQDIAHFIGDSLALARQAQKTDADIIVMCGVNFMAETCKILCPDKTVLLPDMNAGCSLADSCKAEDLKKMKQKYPHHKVITYVNTTAEVKALSDITCTSGNAVKVVESLSEDTPIIFAPDYNLGAYINTLTNRQMLLWNGGCHVHERFSIDAIIELKKANPNAPVLAHPECKSHILKAADVIGSTAKLLEYVKTHDEFSTYIVATEAGILHQMQQSCPDKTFIAVPPEISEETIGCQCNECRYMKMNTMEKLYLTLKYEYPAISLPDSLISEAVKPIERMLEL